MSTLKKKTKKLSAVDLAFDTMERMFYLLERGWYDSYDVQTVYNCYNVATYQNEFFVYVVDSVEEWAAQASEVRPVDAESKQALEQLIGLISDSNR